MQLQFTKHQKVSLKNLPALSERWLHERIAEDPTILGLGEVDLLDSERIQGGRGRLDLLLYDSENNIRYEVEIMLGATDPSHIIRCIEYRDVERRRFPAYDHVAVLVAEEVTTRFLNVMSLLAGTVPLIAIQLDALTVDDKLLLNFVRVLDERILRADDENDPEGEDADRGYWQARVGPEQLAVCDRVLGYLNAKASRPQSFSYKKHFVGLTPGGTTLKNFVKFTPKRKFVHINVRLSNVPEWQQRFDDAGLSNSPRLAGKAIRVTLNPNELDTHEELVRQLVHQAVEENQG